MDTNLKVNIISALGIDNLPPKEQEDIITRVGALIFQKVMMRVMDELDENDQDILEKLVDQGSTPEVLFDFLREKEPNLSVIIREESAKFKQESLNIINQIGK